VNRWARAPYLSAATSPQVRRVLELTGVVEHLPLET
jgi:hypothetical protein